MNRSIRWLLTELNISSLNPNKINFSNGKMICYHLTSHENWARYNIKAKAKLEDETYKGEAWYQSPSSIEAKDNLINNLEKDKLIKLIQKGEISFNKKTKFDVEEYVIGDMISDPFTDTSGFSPGGGDYHGKGLYTCYQFNPRIASSYGNICLVFEIDISNFLITFEDLAKHVHGDNWTIKDQLLKLYSRGEKSPESIEYFRKSLDTISDNALIMPKTIIGSTDRTAAISLNLIRTFDKTFIPSLYDGIILFGQGDGPVCVSFYPKYDARLIGLGRLNEDRPEIVDWYSSLNDFVQGNASNKLDFATMNAIADKETDYIEKAKMKEGERLPYNEKYIDIQTFFKEFKNRRASIDKDPAGKVLSFYREAKESGDDIMISFFLKSFKNSNFVYSENVVGLGEVYNELIDELIKLYDKEGTELEIYYYKNVLKTCNELNLKPSDFFLQAAIEKGLSAKAYLQTSDVYAAKMFYFELMQYLEKNTVSTAIQSLIDERMDESGPNIAISSRSAERISEFYSTAKESNKDKIINTLVDIMPEGIPNLRWQDVKPKNYKAANEIIERIIESITKLNQEYDYKFIFVQMLYFDLAKVDYFSAKIDEFLANSFLEKFNKIKNASNNNLFINTLNYVTRKLGDSHPIVQEVNELLKMEINKADNDIEIFLEQLNLGKITSKKLKNKIEEFKSDLSYITYLSRQSKDWFKNLFDSVMKNIIIKNFRVLGKQETTFLLAILMGKDIVLSKEDQFKFTRKFGKSDFNNKNMIANYKHLDPDVFIELLGPDLAKGGMGAGLSFQGFEHCANVYRLLYKHKKIVDLFCKVGKPGLMKMITLNLSDELAGKSKPRHSWAQSGMLGTFSFGYSIDTLSYIDIPVEQIKISDAVNMDDISWFEYFIDESKKTPKRGLKGAIDELEMNLNNKKLKMQPSTSIPSNDDLDPELDLSHRKIFGNSLKEVYKF